VHTHGVDVGAIEQGFVGGRIVAFDPIDQFILAQEPGRGGRLGRRLDRFCFLDFGELGGSRNFDGLDGRLSGERFCALGAQ